MSGNQGNGGSNANHRRERRRTRYHKNAVIQRDNQICYFCGGLGLTVDHLLPITKGGFSTPSNLVCCCDVCNCEKADMTESEYRTYCNLRNTDQELQNHRQTLEQKLRYVDCSACNRKTTKSQRKNGLCQRCRNI